MHRRRSEEGQASVELVALLPLVAVVGLALWQALLVGQALWLTSGAARAAARAQAVGTDPERAARRALPDHLEQRLRIDADDEDGSVAVTVRLPSVAGVGLGDLTRTSRMAPQS